MFSNTKLLLNVDKYYHSRYNGILIPGQIVCFNKRVSYCNWWFVKNLKIYQRKSVYINNYISYYITKRCRYQKTNLAKKWNSRLQCFIMKSSHKYTKLRKQEFICIILSDCIILLHGWGKVFMTVWDILYSLFSLYRNIMTEVLLSF